MIAAHAVEVAVDVAERADQHGDGVQTSQADGLSQPAGAGYGMSRAERLRRAGAPAPAGRACPR